ncbi:hypothetical protein SDC9_61720 [bioreactor metagenome]|uniref:Uncharacterized protein n=1 Tax=bioreactor metagenome TaxID=1076179 RepID=A0A644XHU6_9ZZZZ
MQSDVKEVYDDCFNNSCLLYVNKDQFLPNLVKDLSRFIDALNYSIIEGKYVIDLQFKAKCHEIQAEISNSFNYEDVLSNLPQGIDKDLLVPIVVLVKKNLKAIIENMIDFVELVTNDDLNDVNNLAFTNKEISLWMLHNESLDIRIKLLTINCELAFYDHNCIPSEHFWQGIISIKEQIQKIDAGSDEIYQIIENKCHFLIYKAILVSERKNKYINNNKILKYIPEDYNFKYFKKFLTLEIIYNGPTIKRSELIHTFLNNEKYTLFNYFVLIKHYKDDHKSTKLLNKLYSRFSKDYNLFVSDPVNSECDKYAWKIARHYFLNNLLSVHASNNDLTGAESLMTRIEISQAETGIKNYFSYLKYFQLLVREAEKLFHNYDKGQDIYLIIEKIRNCYSHLKENVSWSHFNFPLPFQLETKECVDDTDHQHVFLYSSYILPIHYVSVENEFQKAGNDLIFNERFESYFAALKKVYNDSEEIKKEVKRNDRKSMETLTIFTAVISFLIGNGYIFGNISNNAYFLPLSLTFNFGIGLFVLLMYLINNDFQIKKRKYYHIAVGILIALFISASTFFIIPKQTPANSGKNSIGQIEKIKRISSSVQK